MTTQYAILKGLPNGLALDAGKLFTLAAPDTVVTGNTFGFSNRTNANTQYVVEITRATALPAGDYTFIAYIGSSPKAEIALTFLGTDGETATETARLAVLDSDITDQLGRIESNTGAGARTVTITVNDGTTALQNARVRVTEGVNSYTSTTNSSGVVVFNLDDATYMVAIAKSGYTYAGTTLVVDGAESPTYSMTATNVTSPTNPDLSAIEVLCLDDDFAAASGIDVDFRMSAVASGDQNRAHPGAKKTVTSNGSGIARFEGPQGATIEWKRGTGQVWTAVTLDNDSVTNVTSLIGSP